MNVRNGVVKSWGTILELETTNYSTKASLRKSLEMKVISDENLNLEISLRTLRPGGLARK